ncbi:MAG: thioredoxin [Rhodospirillales bacterium]|jgi:thioredoxin 1|nr:thioredoxin [Rhodospirillales bacterium]
MNLTGSRLPELADAVALSRFVNDPSRPSLVLFDAPGCSPGRRIEERLLQMAGTPDAAFGRLDVDRLPDVARRYGVSAVPTLAVFRSGQLAASRIGEIEADDLQDWLDEAL